VELRNFVDSMSRERDCVKFSTSPTRETKLLYQRRQPLHLNSPTMPASRDVLCAHCGKYMNPKREREHRKLGVMPYSSPPPAFQSRLRRVVDASDDDDDGPIGSSSRTDGAPNDPDGGISGGQIDDDFADVPHIDGRAIEDIDYDMDVENNEEPSDDNLNTIPRADGTTVTDHWRRMLEADDSDSDSGSDDELPYPKLEDSDEESDDGFVDWAVIEAGSGLSAWDRLGEGYEREAAAIGERVCIRASIQLYLMLPRLSCSRATEHV
jgi:hypothetical protein